MSADNFYQPSVMELAQTGDLRAIAYWLNGFLMPQNIFVRVGKTRSGCLQVLLEFERQPDRDRVVRFLCNRLYRLRSNVIKNVRIAARPIGSRKIIWSQSVCLLANPSGRSTQPRMVISRASSQSQASSEASAPTGGAMIVRPAQPPSFAIQRDRNVVLRRRRSLVLGGSAAAAFLIGGAFELSQHRESANSTTARSGTVKTAAGDRVAVAQQTVQNPQDPTVTLTFSGDLTTTQVQSAALVDTRSDVALANLDAPPAELDVPLSSDRVNILNLANRELSRDGIDRTLGHLEEAGIRAIGAGRNRREARRPQILEVKGQRIAYLGYSGSDLRAAGNWRAGLNSAVSRRLSEDIQAIRSQVDWVVVNYCWNQDLAEYPAEWQVKLARLAIDEGADLVVGHHPNVLQGAEIYKGRAIAYSLGNFVFADSQADPNTDYDTAVLKVSLRESGFAGTQARQMRIEFVPVQVRQSQPAIAVGENARRISQYMRQASGLFEQPLQSPTILDVRSAGDAPAIDPAPVEPPIAPANPLPPSDSFIAPPSTPASPDSFITEPELPPTRTKEIRLDDRQKPTEAQNVDDRHIVPPAAAPTEYQPSAPAPLEPAPVEATIDSIARLPAATPKPAIESPKPIETAIATVPTRTAIELSAIEPVSEPVSEPVVTAVPTVEATVDPAIVPEADPTDPAASPAKSPN